MQFSLQPTTQDPKTSNRLTGPAQSAGKSKDAIFFPRLKTQMPPGELGRRFPHAAKILSCHAHVAVIVSGVRGLVMKTKFSPRRKS